MKICKDGLSPFENDILSVTYVAPTTRKSIDATALKKKACVGTGLFVAIAFFRIQ